MIYSPKTRTTKQAFNGFAAGNFNWEIVLSILPASYNFEWTTWQHPMI